MMRFFTLLLAGALLMTSQPAWALITARYCVGYQNLSYADGSTGDLLTGSSTPAYGVVLRVIWNDNTVQDLGLAWNGSTPGCADLLFDNSNAPFEVKILRRAVIAGNTLEVVNASGALLTTTWLTNHTPTNNGLYYTNIGYTDSINVLAAASYAMQRRDGGISGETFRFVLDSCPGQATSCFDPATDEIYIHDSHVDRKFIITHEFGHALSSAANGWNSSDVDYDANVGPCTSAYTNSSHRMNSKEFQSAAAVEGIAHFYSALAFNSDVHDADCDIEKHYNPDWNRNGSTSDLVDVDIFSCEEGVSVASVDNNDYTGDYCTASGAWQNRGTEYDWLRMFWDLHTSYDVSTPTIFEIWNRANPHNWNPNGIGTGSGYPATRLSDAAFSVGGSTLQDDYDDCAGYNGTWR